MTEQQVILQSKFSDWRGSLEQVDDVCMIGLKVQLQLFTTEVQRSQRRHRGFFGNEWNADYADDYDLKRFLLCVYALDF